MKTKVIALILAAVMAFLSFAGCQGGGKTVTTGKTSAIKDEEFGSVYIGGYTIDEFNALGFEFGDSVGIELDNGKIYEDIPYYSGYYVPVGEMLLCGYPGYPHVAIARNYGDSTWEEFELTENSKITVTLNEKGKYKSTQELYALQYTDSRDDYASDVVFANFREVTGGSLKPSTFYRSASPCDNQHGRASYANKLCEQYGIKFALNLSDNIEKYKSYVEAEDFDSAYYNGLYQSGDVLLLAMNANYRSDDFARIISGAFAEMVNQPSPVIIHCVEGKDRTGFVCALLLALAGASPQEIIDDYMITYDNYYGITKENNPDKYSAILQNVNDFLYCMCEAKKGTPLDTLNIKEGAENYLRRGGLTDETIAAIEEYITVK